MSRKTDRKKSQNPGEPEKGPLLPWPDVPKIVFDFGPGHRLNMRVGWMLSDPMGMTAYVAGYRKAAEALFEHVDKSPAVSDFVLFQFAFLVSISY